MRKSKWVCAASFVSATVIKCSPFSFTGLSDEHARCFPTLHRRCFCCNTVITIEDLTIMEHSYIVNPFVAIICTICKCAVLVKTTLFVALNQHERNCGQHVKKHTREERKAIVLQLKNQMKAIVEHIWHQSKEMMQLLPCWKIIASLANPSIFAPYVKDWYQTVVLITVQDII